MIEPPLPELNTNIFSYFASFFEARRPLNPTRKSLTRMRSAQVKACKLLVVVHRGHNIPTRNVKEEENSYRQFRAQRMRNEESAGEKQYVRKSEGVDNIGATQQEEAEKQQKEGSAGAAVEQDKPPQAVPANNALKTTAAPSATASNTAPQQDQAVPKDVCLKHCHCFA